MKMRELNNHVDKDDINNYDYMRAPPVQLKAWEKFVYFLYNPKEGKIFDKTGRQWGITGLFYLCFLSVLALLFAVCMAGLLATIDKSKPRWVLDESLIGSSPGLGFRPISEKTNELALIVYKSSNSTQIQTWISRIDKFLEVYQNRSLLSNGGENQEICSYDHPSPRPKMVCEVDIKSDFGPCSPGSGYGFNNSSPCIFIKLNKIISWVPEYYNKSDLPENMPKSLKDHIRNTITDDKYLKTVWVSCQGAEGKDEPLIGEIDYYPKKVQGFPGYYYPYQNLEGYLSPLVAVHFKRPARNQIVGVECRAWAKNIKHDKKEKLGMVYFELLIDD